MEEKREKILLVEDDPSIEEVVVQFLEQARYEVIAYQNGSDAFEKLHDHQYACAILDLNLPGMDGLDLLRELRKESTAPVLIISARGEEMDRVLGLELGADDYVTKPFSPRELVARVKAQIRRTDRIEQDVRSEIEESHGFQLNEDSRQLFVQGDKLELSPTEFEMMRVLLSSPNVTFSRDELLDQVWGEQYLGESRRVDLVVSKIRQKLTEVGAPQSIRSVWGVGYRLEI